MFYLIQIFCLFLGYSNHQRKHQRIFFKILSQALKRAFNMHNALWILKLFAKWSKLNRNDNINSYIKDNINSDNIEQCHWVHIQVIKILCKSFFFFFQNSNVMQSILCESKENELILYRDIKNTYDEVDIGLRSPDDSFGGSRIHWENSPPSSSLIRSQWQVSGSYRGYLIRSLHSGGGLLPTINRKFTTFNFKAWKRKTIIFNNGIWLSKCF